MVVLQDRLRLGELLSHAWLAEEEVGEVAGSSDSISGGGANTILIPHSHKSSSSSQDSV